MKVLVTGATGFVGLRLLSHLREAGMSPVALVRKSSRTEDIQALNFPMIVGDLATGGGLEEALSDCDAVVHSAGGGRVKRVADFYTNNTETTTTLLDAVETHCPSIKRFILVSSIAARGPGSTQDAAGPQSHYGKSKAQAETKTLSLAENFPVTVFQPPSLYGPGDTRFLPLFKAVNRGFVTLPASQAEASFLHVDDMCQAMVCALRTPHPSGKVFELDDGGTHPITSLVRFIQRGLDAKEPRLIRIPHALLWTAALCLEAGATLGGKTTFLTRDKVRDLSHGQWATDASAFREETGWRPLISLEDGMGETARWYKDHGLLP